MYVDHENIDGRIVLGSGIVIAYENKPLKLRINSPREPGAEPLLLVMGFKSNKKTKEPQIQTHLDGRELTLTFVNYDNILGAGSLKPIYLGDNPFADLYGHFRVYAFANAEGDKTVHYTLYEVDKPTTRTKNSKSSEKKDGGKKK